MRGKSEWRVSEERESRVRRESQGEERGSRVRRVRESGMRREGLG